MVRHVAYRLACLATIFPLYLAGAEAHAADSGAPAYRLEEIIQLALTRHPALAGAQGALEQSRGQQVAAKAFLNPTVDGRGGRGAIRDPDNGISINEVYVTVSQPLEWLGKRAARQRAAEAGFVGATAGIEEARLNVIAEVKIAFYDLLLTQRGVEIVQNNLTALEEVARIAKIRVRTGEAPRFEAVKADVEVLKARQDLARARNAVRLGRITLDTLTAGGLGQMFSIQGDFRSFENGPALESLTARMLELHPSLRRLRKLVDRADFAVLTEQQSRVPDVSVYGGYTREAGREATWGGLSVPTPVWYQRQGEIAAALGAKRKEEAEFILTRYELLKAVQQHHQEAETWAEQIRVFDKGLLKQAQEALRIAQVSFQQGAATLLEVLDAQRVARQVNWEYAQARRELSVSLSRLERAAGGDL